MSDPKPKPSKRTKRRRWDRARRFRATREGKVWMGTAIGMGFAAVNTGNNLLYLVLGLMLSMLLLSGTLSDVVLFRVRLARRLPRRVHAGVPTIVEIELHNDKPYFPSYSVEVEDLEEGEEPEVPDGGRSRMRRAFFLKVSPRERGVVGYRRVFTKRGEVSLYRLLISTRYPFGLVEKTHRYRVEDKVLVYPRRVPVQTRKVISGLHGDQLPTQQRGVGDDTLGLREYRPGDDARLVHWRRSAARDELVIRETAREAHRVLSVSLDQREPDFRDEAEGERWRTGFEHAISEAGSLAEAVHAAGVAVEVLVRGGASPLVGPGESFEPIWRYLALLQSSPDETAAFPRARGEVHAIRVMLVDTVDGIPGVVREAA